MKTERSIQRETGIQSRNTPQYQRQKDTEIEAEREKRGERGTKGGRERERRN